MTVATWWESWRRSTAAWLLSLMEDSSYKAGAATALRSRARGEAHKLRPSTRWEPCQVNIQDWPTPATNVMLPHWVAGYEAGLRAPFDADLDNDATERDPAPVMLDLDPEPTDEIDNATTDQDAVPTVASVVFRAKPVRQAVTVLSALGLQRAKRTA